MQLPINARLREAWEQRWQAVEVEGTAQNKTFMEAAARLGVGVFASAPLQEGQLLQDSQLRVRAEPAWCHLRIQFILRLLHFVPDRRKVL